MEKSLYQAPVGIANLPDAGEPAMEIEIEDPEAVHIHAGPVDIELSKGGDEEFSKNLAEDMDESTLATIASDLMADIEADINSRKDWVEMFVKGLDVLGMKYEERTEPWNGACGVYSTILTEAAVRFQSETILETFPAAGPVKTEIIGAIDKLKEEAAERVKEDMNYKLTEEMPEYRPEHERLLFNLGLIGAGFKKVYFDPSLDRQTAIFIPAEDVIIPYGASSAMTSERVTHMMRKTKNELKKLQVAGFYRDVDLGEPTQIHSDIEKKKAEDQGYSITEDNRYQIAESQVDYDLPGYEDEDGIALPYIITIERGTNKVLSIYRNWKQTDKTKQKRVHFTQYTYIPGFGVYGLGLIHLIGGYARAGTSLLRQLVDAGTLANLPGGLKSRGLRVKGDDTPIAPGEFRDVDVPSGSIKDNIMTLPYKEPSQVLAGLLDKITDEGRRLGSIADMNVSDMSANSPVGTTLALLERQLKTMSAVQARVHYSMKQEFKLLKAIIRDFTPSQYDYDPTTGDKTAKREDYDMVEVIPVSDPNSSTMAQRIMQYQAVMQMSQQAPQIYNLAQLHRQMIDVLGVPNADKLVPIEDDLTPTDPISENMAFLNGKPTKAFMYQDHDAHIAVHQAMVQDPLLAAQIGQNPQAQQMTAAIQAHISQHLAFAYRKKIEDQLGTSLPEPDETIPKDMEVQLSRLVAQAAQQVLAQSKGQAAQAQAQQQAQDPLIQMQQQELQLKAQDVQTKAQKVQGDLQLKQQELALKQQEMQAKQGETPQMMAQRHAMEMAQAHQQIQQAEEQHRMEMAHQAQQHVQGLRHQAQSHLVNTMTAAQQAEHKMRITQEQADLQAKIKEQQAAQQPTQPGGE